MSYAKTLPRPYYVGVTLRPDEYERITADAEKFGVSKAEALRLNCRDFFTEPVRCGRIPGVSPWKRSANEERPAWCPGALFVQASDLDFDRRHSAQLSGELKNLGQVQQ